MKKLFLSLLMFVVATTFRAETTLVVHKKTGETIEYAFREKPIITYLDGNIIISTKDESVEYPISKMLKITFHEVNNDETRIIAPANTAPQPTYIYSVGGILMRTLQPTEKGYTSASLGDLPSGSYIIKNGNTYYKITKR